MSRLHQPVVVGVRGPHAAAMRLAMREALHGRTYVRFVHCADELVGQHVLDAIRPHAEAEPRQPPMSFELVEAGVVEALERAARTARALVIGCRGLGWYTELAVGDVVARLTRHSDSPVIVVPEGEGPRSDGEVVLCDAGTPLDEATWQFAFSQARVRDAVLRVAPTDGRPIESTLRPWREQFPDVRVEVGHPSDSDACAVAVLQRPRDRSAPFADAVPAVVGLATEHGCSVAVVPPTAW